MLVQNRKQFEAARTILLEADVVAVDTETTGLEPYRGDVLCGISTWCKLPGQDFEIGYYFPFRHKPGDSLFDNSENIPEAWMRELKPCFERDNFTAVLHNSKFDLAFLRKENIRICTKMYDTMLLGHMVDENSSNKLKDLAERYIDKNAHKLEKEIKEAVRRKGGYDKVAPATMEPYAVKDAEYTYRLFPILFDELGKQDMQKLCPDVMQFIYMLHEMEWYGTGIDKQLAAQLAFETQQKMRKLEDELGFDPLKLNTLAKKLFLPQPDGLGFIPGALTREIMPEFPHGRPVMDEATLSNYTHPVVDKVLEYRGYVKANSTWYEGFLTGADKNGRIHPTFNIHGTKTSRLSCSNPNMQQLPRNVEDTPARRLLVPPPGYGLWEFDYSQIEFRVGTVYANESRMLETLKAGGDVYKTAADALGLTRFQGKTLSLGTIYGLGAVKLAATFDVSIEEAQSILRSFHSEFPGYQMTAKAAEDAAASQGWVKLWTGRRRHFPERWECHKAFNSICQGGAAEIMKRTMLDFWNEPDDENYRCILQVHDSLLFEIKLEHAEGIIAMIKKLMEWPSTVFPVPFPVDVKPWRLSA